MKKASQTPQFASADFLVYRDTWPDNDFAQLYVIYPNVGGAQARQSDLTRHRRASIATRLMRAAVVTFALILISGSTKPVGAVMTTIGTLVCFGTFLAAAAVRDGYHLPASHLTSIKVGSFHEEIESVAEDVPGTAVDAALDAMPPENAADAIAAIALAFSARRRSHEKDRPEMNAVIAKAGDEILRTARALQADPDGGEQLLTDRDRFKAKIPARFTGDIQDEQ